MTTREVLLKARERIARPQDWRKGSDGYRNGRAPECAMEAILMVDPAMAERAVDLLKRRAGTRSSLPAWNDDPQRTHADVLAAFRPRY